MLEIFQTFPPIEIFQLVEEAKMKISLKIAGFSFVDELDLKKGFKHKEVFHKSSTSSNVDQNKSILRKPILQFSSFGSFGSLEKSPPIKSPFSLNLDNSSLNANSSIFTTSLLCHVCNSITTRKQPRKYGAVCCELCRKFMSKMIKRLASSNKNPLNFQCLKGDGLLHLLIKILFKFQ